MFTQESKRVPGYNIECRINAEGLF